MLDSRRWCTFIIALALLSTAMGCRSITDHTPGAHTALQDGRRIHYVDSGGRADEAIVLVHGWSSSTVAWKHQDPSLAELGRVLVVDLIGHGQSEAPEGEFTAPLLAASVAAAMDDAGVARAVLVGHSNGVPVAMNFYARYPERTLGIVGVDGTLQQLFDRAQFESMFGPFLGDQWRETMTTMIEFMPGPGLSQADRSTITEMALATPHVTVTGAAEAMLDPAAWSDDPIEVPLMLVLARQPTWDAAYEAYVRRRAPHVDYRVWSDIGHYIQMERPAELHAALEGFLETNSLLQ